MVYYFFRGRVGLYAILKSIGLREGDQVIVPGFTCVVVPNAVWYAGGQPVYVDISGSNFNVTVDTIESGKGVSWDPRKARALIVQHTFGIPVDMDPIVEFCRHHQLFLIEDCCHALGSEYKGRPVGTFGDAAFFSSQWSKPVTTGLGGWVIVNNPSLDERLRSFYPDIPHPSWGESLALRLQYHIYEALISSRNFWTLQALYRFLSKARVVVPSSTNVELQYGQPKGYAKRMSAWQISTLRKALSQLDLVLEHRRSIVSAYEESIADMNYPWSQLNGHFSPVFLRYPVLVRDKAEALAAAKRAKVEIGDWFLSPLHPLLSGWEKRGYKLGTCPVGERVCSQVVNLPTHPRIDPHEAEQIARFIRPYLVALQSGS